MIIKNIFISSIVLFLDVGFSQASSISKQTINLACTADGELAVAFQIDPSTGCNINTDLEVVDCHIRSSEIKFTMILDRGKSNNRITAERITKIDRLTGQFVRKDYGARSENSDLELAVITSGTCEKIEAPKF